MAGKTVDEKERISTVENNPVNGISEAERYQLSRQDASVSARKSPLGR